MALSDGVFAIIITILVLELKVPPHLSQESFPALVEELRPTFVAWVASFLITGMYWVGHRDVFARVRFVNRDLVWLNLLFLLPASLIPFAASVLGQYPDESFALHIYGVVMIAASLMSLALYGYVIRHPGLPWAGEGQRPVVGRIPADRLAHRGLRDRHGPGRRVDVGERGPVPVRPGPLFPAGHDPASTTRDTGPDR